MRLSYLMLFGRSRLDNLNYPLRAHEESHRIFNFIINQGDVLTGLGDLLESIPR